MWKTEFEELIQGKISDQDYKVIEKVYQFHPAISETCGKEEVAGLYKSFGMTVFYDMLPRAEKASRMEPWDYPERKMEQAETEKMKRSLRKVSYIAGFLFGWILAEVLVTIVRLLFLIL